MLICSLLIPRLPLLAALGERRELLGRPAALGPEPGREQAVGEASPAAEAFGIRAGMPLSEALARCPALLLIPPDPGRAAAVWEAVVRRLEGIGAEVESEGDGTAYFAVDPLRGLWGQRPEGVLERAATAIGQPARIAAAPTRFCAYVAAATAPSRRRRVPRVIRPGSERDFLAPQPIALLGGRLRATAGDPGGRLLATLERLGVRTLGELAELPRAAVADRFGALGLEARELASGGDRPLRPRRPHEELEQALALPEAASGPQLERALELLVERLLADRRRDGRALRALLIEARLAAGGSWRTRVALRSATASPERLRLALLPRLRGLPSPATDMTLRALELGPRSATQQALGERDEERRRERLAEGVRQIRATAGRDAVLRVLDLDPGSRIPERRAALAPYNEGDG